MAHLSSRQVRPTIWVQLVGIFPNRVQGVRAFLD